MMESIEKIKDNGKQNIDVPNLYGSQSFIASREEKIAVLFSYPIAFLYTYILFPGINQISWDAVITAFTVLFCASAELMHKKLKASTESYIWLGCIAAILVSLLLRRNQVWGDEIAVFLLHCYAVYWLLARSGWLTEGSSGPFAPLDAINGFFVYPLKRFFLRIRVLWSLINAKTREKGKSAILVAVAVAAILFYMAGTLLASADEVFNRIIGGLIRYFSFVDISEFIIRFVISIPVGAYLYGLVVGINREDPQMAQKRSESILDTLKEIRKVPTNIWTFILAAFSLLYLSFFIIQGSYLFGAFTRSLPEGFTVAQYARQGFFELCQIMALNFVLLWLVIKSSHEDIRQNKPAVLMCVVLLAESILFSITSFSKLCLYISCFGFTPLRIQSSWLILVLFCGSVMAIYSVITGKRSFRTWIFLSGISLALTHLY